MKKLKYLVAFMLLIMFIILVQTFAYEYNGTGKWPSSNVNYAISSDVPSGYVNPIVWAAEMWTDNTDFQLIRNNSSQINVYVYNYGSTDWDGITYVNGISLDQRVNATYSYANIQINSAHADFYDDVRKKLVICHEFGHTASLAHVPNYAMMYYNDVWVAYQHNPSLRYSPDADDINGINNRY